MKKWLCTMLLAACLPVAAADKTKLTIHVTDDLGKPVDNAEVIIKFVAGRNIKAAGLRKIRKSWELRSSQQGTVSIPEIPQGKILIQVNAKGYQTFGQNFDIQEDERTVEVQLKPPQQQYSAHEP